MNFNNLLEGKTVFITGGSRGLGKALCIECARQGAGIAFIYSRDVAGAKETAAEIESLGRKVCAIQASVTDSASLSAAVKQTEAQLGPIDILINNAGMSQPYPLALTDETDWDLVVDTNLKGQFLTLRQVVPGMMRRRCGVILNIGSLAGLRLIEAPVHYSASKAGVKGLSEALSKEVARYNIRVNCLAPGLLDEGVGQSLPEHRLRDYVNHIALKRVGRLEEVAHCAAFLVSERNSYMSGSTLLMDGGF